MQSKELYEKISILTSLILCFYGLSVCANENTQQPSTEKESFQLTAYIDENGDLIIPGKKRLLGIFLNQEESSAVPSKEWNVKTFCFFNLSEFQEAFQTLGVNPRVL